MGKLVLMRTSATGWTRVGETVNSGETPKVFLGLVVGACGNLSPAHKTEANEIMHAKGGDMMYCRAEKLSAWSFANGVQIEIEHTGKGCGFISRLS